MGRKHLFDWSEWIIFIVVLANSNCITTAASWEETRLGKNLVYVWTVYETLEGEMTDTGSGETWRHRRANDSQLTNEVDFITQSVTHSDSQGQTSSFIGPVPAVHPNILLYGLN